MKFKCKECGNCCGPTPFTVKMFNRFKDQALRKYELKQFYEEGLVVPITDDNDCVFLDANNRCVIYKNRPKICRIYGMKDGLRCYHQGKNKKVD